MKPRDRIPQIALVDWGIGGLGVRAELRRLRPELAVTYVSDSGATPYGRLPPPALAERLERVVAVLADRGVRQVFLACNAASTVLEAGHSFALPTRGMITPGIASVIASGQRRIGVVGGRRTITSGVYRRALEAHGLEVHQRIAQPLSAAIEAGRSDHAETRALVRRIVGPLRSVDALLLACTHYPAASAAFRDALPAVALIDPAGRAAEDLLASLGPSTDADRGEDRVLTSGDARAMSEAARAAFGVELPRIGALGC